MVCVSIKGSQLRRPENQQPRKLTAFFSLESEKILWPWAHQKINVCLTGKGSWCFYRNYFKCRIYPKMNSHPHALKYGDRDWYTAEWGRMLEKQIGDLANRIKISSKGVIAGRKHRLRQMHLNFCDERVLAPKPKIAQKEKKRLSRKFCRGKPLWCLKNVHLGSCRDLLNLLN